MLSCIIVTTTQQQSVSSFSSACAARKQASGTRHSCSLQLRDTNICPPQLNSHSTAALLRNAELYFVKASANHEHFWMDPVVTSRATNSGHFEAQCRAIQSAYKRMWNGQVVTSCFKMHQKSFSVGAPTDPARGAYEAPPDLLVRWGSRHPPPIPSPSCLWHLGPGISLLSSFRHHRVILCRLLQSS